MHRGLHPCSSVYRLHIPRAWGNGELWSIKECAEQERSNLFDYAANSNERLLKAVTEELQPTTKIDGKNKEEWKIERQAAWEKKALHGKFQREIGNTRSKEVAVVESRLVKTRNWEPYMCCPRTNTKNKCSKKWYWSPVLVVSMEALQEESWKHHPCCQFMFCPSWKPI